MLFLTRSWPFVSHSRVHGEKSLVSGFLLFLLIILPASAIQTHTADPGARTVQIVYESDVRGYYLPCG